MKYRKIIRIFSIFGGVSSTEESCRGPVKPPNFLRSLSEMSVRPALIVRKVGKYSGDDFLIYYSIPPFEVHSILNFKEIDIFRSGLQATPIRQ